MSKRVTVTVRLTMPQCQTILWGLDMVEMEIVTLLEMGSSDNPQCVSDWRKIVRMARITRKIIEEEAGASSAKRKK